MISFDGINAADELYNSQKQYAKSEVDNNFAQELLKQAIQGFGDQVVARHKLQIARAHMGHYNQKEQFWTEMVKKELGGFKKSWELMKD